ncbi:alpha/beta fold hydrolase [Actinokineospora terrae]|uniref:alpha/beta fold hydrolase n=1 Tax=Actinokineospora terrae TaxID=155974 RepID=UPI000A9F54EB|nr:alpha/beta fold hydrolase [Actinokineospora terrae]
MRWVFAARGHDVRELLRVDDRRGRGAGVCAPTWHRVAPVLVEQGFTVVCPDLRGYGRSRGPDHSAHSKRAVAGDARSLMRALGHDRFAVAGHDRGSAVALRPGPRPPRRGPGHAGGLPSGPDHRPRPRGDRPRRRTAFLR